MKKTPPNPVPLFMVAQLPFNTEEASALNEQMINVMDDDGNLAVVLRNFKALGLYPSLLHQKTRLLEIGCGRGYVLRHLLQHGHGNYHGIEPIESEAKKAQQSLQSHKKERWWIHHGLLEDDALADKVAPESLDVVHSYHVFEHLENPLTMLELAWRWLRPGGKLVIMCPNVEGLFARRGVLRWRCALPTHRWLPGLQVVKEALRRQGFSIKKSFTYGGFAAPRGLFKSTANGLLRLMNQGDVMCVMAQKPKAIKNL